MRSWPIKDFRSESCSQTRRNETQVLTTLNRCLKTKKFFELMLASIYPHQKKKKTTKYEKYQLPDLLSKQRKVSTTRWKSIHSPIYERPYFLLTKRTKILLRSINP